MIPQLLDKDKYLKDNITNSIIIRKIKDYHP